MEESAAVGVITGTVWLYSLLSVLLVSVVSLVGVVTFFLKEEFMHRVLFILVSFASGVLLGGAFFHLLPESARETNYGALTSYGVTGGIVLFFVMERIIQWRHCHIPTSDVHPHPLAWMNLIGDGMHNLMDGMVIAGSFSVGNQIGLVTTLAIVFHEIPQEIGDFGVLVYGGFSKWKALFFNFLSAAIAIIGAIAALLLIEHTQVFLRIIIPLSAGGFIYIACSDLIPELKKDTCSPKVFQQLIAMVVGVALMIIMKYVNEGGV